MNWYGKSPLEMHCPRCGTYGAHPVIRTDPKWYYCGDETKKMFERIVGRDLSYRRRTKRCIKCERRFISVEMANIFLDGLMEEIKRLENSLQLAQSLLNTVSKERDKLEADQQQTSKVITRVSKLLSQTARKREN